MKIIEPGIEVMLSGLETEHITPEQHIEKVGRTCYKSEDKITETSAAKFVSGLVKRGHEAMIEHWNLIFLVDMNQYECIKYDYHMLEERIDIIKGASVRPYLRFTCIRDRVYNYRCVISGNMRAWRNFIKAYYDATERIPSYFYSIIKDYPTFFPEYQDFIPNMIGDVILTPISVNDLINEKEHGAHHNVTIKFICDRGVSHEIVRHRPASYAQESTRYCNYSGDKFDRSITVVKPFWALGNDLVHSFKYGTWRAGCRECEEAYFNLLDAGATPQEARAVLPNSLKTELIMTATLDEWDHFLSLRGASDAHPDMQVEAKMVLDEFHRLFPDRYSSQEE